MTARVSGLFVYPVKSCRGIAVDHAVVTERGLAHDREWRVVVPPAGAASDPARFVTQREHPRLALVGTQVSDHRLALSAPDRADLVVDFGHEGRGGAPGQAVVWRDTVAAIDQGDAAAEWLSSWVGTSLRLLRFDPSFRRYCNRTYAGDSGAHTAFADGYPLLVIGTASLADLNKRLLRRGSDALPMNRFRPNLVIDGLDAYDEDHLSAIEIGPARGATGEVLRLRMVKPCVRCEITTTDQDTAAVGDEPLATLASYRIDSKLDGVTFGINAIVERGAGTRLERGASVSVEWNF